MGLFGPDTRTISGLIYVKHGEVHSMAEARAWMEEFQSAGYKAKAIPNVRNKCVEIWVAEGVDPRMNPEVQSRPTQPQKPQG